MSFGEVNNIILGGGLTQDLFYSPLSTWGLVFQFIGAIIIFFSYAPGSVQSIRTRQTYGLSMTMWVITISALASLSIFALAGIASNPSSPGQFIMVAISEVGSLGFSLIIFTIKAMNISRAKKQGISEEEYCKKLLKSK